MARHTEDRVCYNNVSGVPDIGGMQHACDTLTFVCDVWTSPTIQARSMSKLSALSTCIQDCGGGAKFQKPSVRSTIHAFEVHAIGHQKQRRIDNLEHEPPPHTVVQMIAYLQYFRRAGQAAASSSALLPRMR